MNQTLEKFAPLMGVFAFVLSSTTILVTLTSQISLMSFGKIFMGMFFLTFGGFKIYNLNGFKKAFKKYDILAEKSNTYATTYPFLEFSLGVLYIAIAFFDIPTQFQMITHVLAILIMSIGAFGVLNTLREGRNLKCACLGNVFNVPMTSVTLTEDIIMALMALIMLVSIL